EANAKHADVARENFRNAGLSDVVELRLGAALDTLPSVEGPFDFVFIDADKPNNVAYIEWALKLTHPGSVIVVDNVIRSGGVADLSSTDPSVLGARAALEFLAKEKR